MIWRCRGSDRVRRRRGFTLVEILASTVFLALIVVAVVVLSMSINEQKTITENIVYLSTHNLNCMERLRQMAQTNVGELEGELLDYYGDETFGSVDIETEVTIQSAQLNGVPKYHIYHVVIQSGMRDGKQHLRSEYVLSDIGQVIYVESIGSVEDTDIPDTDGPGSTSGGSGDAGGAEDDGSTGD